MCLCLDWGCDISDSMRAVAICSSFCSSVTCSRHTAFSSPSLIFITARKNCEDPHFRNHLKVPTYHICLLQQPNLELCVH